MDKTLMRNALINPAFEDYFRNFGGCCLNNPLYTQDERIERWTASDEEWLNLDHTYCPIATLDNSSRDRKLSALLKQMTLQEIRQMGRPMEKEKIQQFLVSIRNPFKSKLWRYYVTFLHNLPPQHPKAEELHKTFNIEWVDTGLPKNQSSVIPHPSVY